MTALDLIKGSLRLLGVYASGENPSAAEAADALASLNSLIDSWQNERLMIYAVLPQSFSLVANKKAYTMGPGGDFNTVRPVRVTKINLIYSQSPGVPLTLDVAILDQDQYQSFIVPDTASTIPLWVYIDDGYPLRTLYFYTVPSIVSGLEIFTWQALTSFGAVTDTVAFPPGYERALRYNLALEIAPEYGASAVAQASLIEQIAMSAKANIKSINSRAPLMQTDSALISNSGGYNYLTDSQGR